MALAMKDAGLEHPMVGLKSIVYCTEGYSTVLQIPEVQRFVKMFDAEATRGQVEPFDFKI